MLGELLRSDVDLPKLRLNKKVVLITGGDRGLGKSMAEAIAQKGGRVIIASVDEIACQSLAKKINSGAGAELATATYLDVTNIIQCRKIIAEIVSRAGQLDVLFNNARRLMRGSGLPPKGNSLPIWRTDPKIYEETVMVNVVGTFNMARSAIEHFRSKGYGKIINISTSQRNLAYANNSPYGVTKSALESQTLIWAGDCEAENIMVNSLCPGGAVDSDLSRPQRDSRSLLPVNIMDPLAIWLSSDSSDGVTGCRFNAKFWDPQLSPKEAAKLAREEPVFSVQPEGRFPNT